MSYTLYVLAHTDHQKTYVGITNNLQRRIRQHNQELVGGARYTTANKANGTWYYYALVHDLEKREALRLEWRMHHRRSRRGRTPIEKRLNTLKNLNLQYELCSSHALDASPVNSQAQPRGLSHAVGHNAGVDDPNGLVTTVDSPEVQIDEVVPGS